MLIFIKLKAVIRNRFVEIDFSFIIKKNFKISIETYIKKALIIK